MVLVMILSRQVKAARELLKWTQERLSEESKIPLPTVKRMESKDDQLKGNAENISKLQEVFEAKNVQFILETEGRKRRIGVILEEKLEE